MKKDALNVDIIIGGVYAYSQSSNGSTNVIVGEVTHFTEHKVGMKIIKQGRGVYEDEIKFNEDKVGKKVSTKCNLLFKLAGSVESYKY